MSIVFKDGQVVTAAIGREVFESTSAIASSTHHPHSRLLHLQTTRGHNVVVELPQPDNLSPVNGRPTIYLDQNHWSTLAKARHSPDRVSNERERAAAKRLIALASDRQVVLPMSSAHMAETCKQVDLEQRYWRALTILQLSAGWQLRDPLDLRRFELQQAMMTRFRSRCLLPPAAVTLEPNAVHSDHETGLREVTPDLPAEARWAVHAIRCIGGIVDTMLDDDHVMMNPVPRWATHFQEFADFLFHNPSERELKRRRTYAKFMADTRGELAEAATRCGITTEEFSHWFLKDGEEDVGAMPALGLFRELLHEKLSTNGLQ